MKKKLIALLLTGVMVVSSLAGCGSSAGEKTSETASNGTESAETTVQEAGTVSEENLTETEKIIKEAEAMTMEELAKKAIEESNGKTFYGVGNSSRGKTALPLFIEYLQTIDPSYSMEFEWQQPKNNKIFEQLSADSLKEEGTFTMTLIQDGNQIQSKIQRNGQKQMVRPQRNMMVIYHCRH